MDITSLSNEILKHLVLEFRNNDKPGLPFEEIQNAFQGVSDTDLIKAISILQRGMLSLLKLITFLIL